MKQFAGSLLLLLLILGTTESGGVPKKEDVPKYIDTLKKSTVAKERALAATMLGKRGAINVKDVESAVEPLKKSLQKDSDLDVRRAAAEALGRIGAEPETTVPLLIEALKNKNYPLRMAAANSLGAYGPAAKSALPPLRELKKELANKKDDKILGMIMQNISAKKKQ